MSRYIAGYVRVSTEMQIERDSLTNQQDAIRTYVKAKGASCRMFVDAGQSAKDVERPALQGLLDEIRANRVELVVIVRLDRLTRSLRDLVDLYELFEKHEVALVSLTQSLDTSNPVGRFVFYILGLVSQMERELVAEREMENMQARAKRGKWNGGVTPYGYTCYQLEVHRWLEKEAQSRGVSVGECEKDPQAVNLAQSHALSVVSNPKVLVIDQDEARVVQEIYEAFLRTRTLRSATHHLNRSGFRTRNGLPWAPTSIRRILSNPFYRGTLAYNRRKSYKRTAKKRPENEHILVDGAVPAIVDHKVWGEVSALLDAQKGVPPSQKRSTLLLTGLVHCAKCGGRLLGSGRSEGAHRVYHYYRCRTSVQQGPSVCSGVSAPVEILDKLVTDAVRSIGMNPGAIREQLGEQTNLYRNETVPLLRREKELQGSIAQFKQKMMRLIELYEEGFISKEDFNARRVSLDEDKLHLENELADTRGRLDSGEVLSFDIEQAIGMFGSLGAVYDSLEYEDRRELIKAVIKEVVVDDTSVKYKVRVLPEFFVFKDRMSAHAVIWDIFEKNVVARQMR